MFQYMILNLYNDLLGRFSLGLSSRKRCDSPVHSVSSCGHNKLYNPSSFPLYVGYQKARLKSVFCSRTCLSRKISELAFTKRGIVGFCNGEGCGWARLVPGAQRSHQTSESSSLGIFSRNVMFLRANRPNPPGKLSGKRDSLSPKPAVGLESAWITCFHFNSSLLDPLTGPGVWSAYMNHME